MINKVVNMKSSLLSGGSAHGLRAIAAEVGIQSSLGKLDIHLYENK